MGNYIIEHPTRGTLKDFVSEDEFSFSREGMRNDPESTMQFQTFATARWYVHRLPENVRKDCKILEWVEDEFSWRKAIGISSGSQSG